MKAKVLKEALPPSHLFQDMAEEQAADPLSVESAREQKELIKSFKKDKPASLWSMILSAIQRDVSFTKMMT